MPDWFGPLLSNVGGTVVGGLILALVLFWAREKLFALPEVTGRWYFESKTEGTAYNPFAGMILTYVALLSMDGPRIEGTAEKIYEDSSTGKREYVGANRTRATVTGFVKKNYFSADKVFMHIVEDGHGRESTNVFELKFTRLRRMEGRFLSMVADQTGSGVWQREPFAHRLP